MRATRLGEAAAGQGLRKQVADRLSEPLARRLPLGRREIRALIGLFFLVRTFVYLARTAQKARQAGN